MCTHRWFLSLLPFLLGGCFSTISPEIGPGETPTALDNKAWVRGQVLLFRGPGDRVGMPNYSVSVEWRDSLGNELDDDVIKTGPGGNFVAWAADPRIALVEIAALRCEYDPQNPGWASPWDDSVTLRVVPGATAHQVLVISCDTGVPPLATVEPGTVPAPWVLSSR